MGEITPIEKRAFRFAGWAVVLMGIGLFALLLPETSPLRSPEGSLTSPKSANYANCGAFTVYFLLCTRLNLWLYDQVFCFHKRYRQSDGKYH